VKLYRHSGHWWLTDGGASDRIRGAIHVLYRKYAGQRILPVTSKALAEKLGVEIFNLIRNPSASTGIPFDKALREYLAHCEADGIAVKTVIQKQAQLTRLKIANGLITLNQLTPKAIQDFLDKLPLSGQTKNRYLSTISRFCRYCKRVGYLGIVPTLDLERYTEVNNLRPRVLTRAEIDTFKAATDPTFAAIIELAYQTGMRLGEIQALWTNKWKSVDLKQGIALLEAGQVKNRRLKTIVLNQLAIAAIKALWNNHTALKRDSLTHKWGWLSQRVGITARFHDLRHTFATRLAQSAGRPNPKDISELLGHATQSLANRIYYHPDLNYLKTLVENLPE
jgi:integrase